jgi:hypothetical protein
VHHLIAFGDLQNAGDVRSLATYRWRPCHNPRSR